MNRRSFLRGVVGLIAAPAIVRVASIMPVKSYDTLYGEFEFSGFYSKIPFDQLAQVDPRIMAILERRMNEAYAITMKNMAEHIFSVGTNEDNPLTLSVL